MAKKKAKKRRKTFVTNPARRSGRSMVASASRPPRHWKKHKVYQWNSSPSRRRKYKRNPGDSIKDIALTFGSAGAAAILGPKVVSLLPVSNLIQNLGMIGAGAALAIFGRRKQYLVGAGLGLGLAGMTRAVVSAIPVLAGDNEMTQDEQSAFIDATAQQMAGDEETDYLSGPLNGPLSGPLNGPLSGGLNGNFI
jgi:hypothetical protein